MSPFQCSIPAHHYGIVYEWGCPFGVNNFFKNFEIALKNNNNNNCVVPISYGQDNFLGGQFWAKVRLNSLGGPFNLLDGQMHGHRQLTCYLPHAPLGLMNLRKKKPERTRVLFYHNSLQKRMTNYIIRAPIIYLSIKYTFI